MMNSKHMTKIKRAALVFLSCLQLCSAPVLTAFAAPDWPQFTDEVQAQAGIVIDADTGAVLYEKDADTLYPPASTTKLLTALIVLENCNDLNDVVTFSEEAVRDKEPDSGNRYNVAPGDQLTVEQCLHFMLMQSSNQTADALAEYIAGSNDNFVLLMNNKMKELGLTASSFENPSGLNGETQRVTARELALLAKNAYANPKLLEISKTLSYDLPPMKNTPGGATIENKHRLVSTTDPNIDTYYPPAIAGKPGYLIAAGNTAITYAEQDGRRLIAVVLKGQKLHYFVDSKKMFQYGFSGFENQVISEPELNTFTDADLQYLQNLGLSSSDVTVSGSLTVTVPKETTPDSLQRNITSLPSGVYPDKALAVLEYLYQGHVIGSTYLTDIRKPAASEPVPENLSQTGVPTGETEVPDSGQTPDTTDPQPAKKGNGLLIFLVIVLILIVGGLGGFFYYLRQQEMKRMEDRRKKRRQRLEEMGISQEEFEQMKQAVKRK